MKVLRPILGVVLGLLMIFFYVMDFWSVTCALPLVLSPMVLIWGIKKLIRYRQEYWQNQFSFWIIANFGLGRVVFGVTYFFVPMIANRINISQDLLAYSFWFPLWVRLPIAIICIAATGLIINRMQPEV